MCDINISVGNNMDYVKFRVGLRRLSVSSYQKNICAVSAFSTSSWDYCAVLFWGFFGSIFIVVTLILLNIVEALH